MTPRILLILCILTLLRCSPPSSPSNLTSKNVLKYISSFTKDKISVSDPIIIRFNKNAIDDSQIGTAVSSHFLSISPSIDGKAIWSSKNTIKFQPKNLLNRDQVYSCEVAINKIFVDDEDSEPFVFEFSALDLFVNDEMIGLEEDPNHADYEIFSGVFKANDIIDGDKLKNAFEAQLDGLNMPVIWDVSANKLDYTFTVKDIIRRKTGQKLKLKIKGQDFKNLSSFEKEIYVPGLNEFLLNNASVSVDDDEDYIILKFSDKIKADQELRGLIRIVGYNDELKFERINNELRIYPSKMNNDVFELKISDKIKNIRGLNLNRDYTYSLAFTQLPPAVRLVGKGVIIPGADKVVLPFEAINLNGVIIEVTKIYADNILQFLQNNNIDDGYGLRHVGAIILQKEIALKSINASATPSRWMTYGLDLTDLISVDEKAYYKVVIAFKKSQVDCKCDENFVYEEVFFDYDKSNGDLDVTKSIMDDYYGIYGYNEDYDWENENDPCHLEYFKPQIFVQNNLFHSNLALTVKKLAKNYFVSVNDILTSLPIGAAEVKGYDYQQQLVVSNKTDKDGFCYLDTKNRVSFITVEKNSDINYIKVNPNLALSVSKFDTDGIDISNGIKGYLYAERSVWRPGDSIYMNFVLEMDSPNLKDLPINVQLVDPQGKSCFKKAIIDNVDNVYPIYFKTNMKDKTGNYRLKVEVGGAVFTKSVMVENIKPNRLKIDLDLKKEQLTKGDNPANFDVNATWLHGAPASGLKTQVELIVKSRSITMKKYKDFTFNNALADKVNWNAVIVDGSLDENGHLSVNEKVDNNFDGDFKLTYKTRVFENGGDFSSDVTRINYTGYNTYVGTHLPENKYAENRLDIDKKEIIKFVVVNNLGQPLKNIKVNASIYKLSWRWWWEDYGDNRARYSQDLEREPYEEVNLMTDANGVATWTVTMDDWGRYVIQSQSSISAHISSEIFYVGYPWYGDDNGAKEGATVLNFQLDKESYNVGELATVNIPSGGRSRALITIENKGGILQSQWLETKKGENKYTFYTSKEMTPNAYISISMIQPHNNRDNDLPMRMFGIQPIVVMNKKTILKPVISMAEKLAPEKPFDVTISEDNGEEMIYTIDIVDEGLLDITHYKTPHPWLAFNAKEAYKNDTWDLYDYILGAYGSTIDRMITIGGDEELQSPEDANKANRFKPVVLHLGPYKLKKGQKVKHRFIMPNYIGSVRAMVVCANINKSYGHTEKTVKVNSPLMVLGTLPRVLHVGDELGLAADVFVTEKGINDVNITAKDLSDNINFNQKKTQLHFDEIGDKLKEFGFKVPYNNGISKIGINVESGRHKAHTTIEIDVVNPNAEQKEFYEKTLKGQGAFDELIDPIGTNGTNKLLVEISSMPPIKLGDRLRYLIRYPHGCIEQTTSSVFPQMYLSSLVDLNDQQISNTERNIKAGISRLGRFQTSDGGFSYWPGNRRSDEWGSSYAGHFLTLAKKEGYYVSQDMLNNWLSYQKNQAKNWRASSNLYYSRNSSQFIQAYRLYTLALAGQPMLGEMNRMRTMKSLSVMGHWRLAAAYALIGKADIAKELIKNISNHIKPYNALFGSYGSSERDLAMILETYIDLGDNVGAAKIAKSVAESLNAQKWMSTQTTAYCLYAMQKYAKGNSKSVVTNFSLKLGHHVLQNVNLNKPIYKFEYDFEGTNAENISIKNLGKNVLFINIVNVGQPMPGDEVSVEKDLKMSVIYQDESGQTINPVNLKRGDDIYSIVTISNPGTRGINYHNLVLEQSFPSGWEIINERFENNGLSKSNQIQYQDIKDDKIFSYLYVGKNKSVTIKTKLKAAYVGHFYLPSIACKAMYDNSIYVQKKGKWVDVSL